MPIDLQIDQDHRCVFSTAYGDLVDRDLIKHQRRLKAHPRFRGSFDQILDLTGATRVEVSPAIIIRIARDNPFTHGSRQAIVADAPKSFTPARMYQAYTNRSPDEVIVFRHYLFAARWLGLDLRSAPAPSRRG